jgi:hypothetical protein
MNKATRIQKIAEIVERDREKPYGKTDIPWQGKLVSMPVYQVPLDYLIYNKYNGRILSRTKSLESQGQDINAETEEGRKHLESLLMESNPSRNKQTLESIKSLGQEKVGIITRDGIIIDGNRRAMLLSQAGKDLFKTVVLEVTLEEDPLEIEKLETTYQMGEDEKLGYNATEKYLKAKGLHKRGVSVEKIAAWMGETQGTVQQYLDVMETMDDYLDYLGYNGVYTQLDGREDLFINLTKWLAGFYGEGSAKGFDGYRNSDVDDLKLISYDYIRAKFEGKEFRVIADGLKQNHFFGDKTIWMSFRDFHVSRVDSIKDSHDSLNLDSDNLKAYLDDRDRVFYEKTKGPDGKSFLDENIDFHKQQLRYKKSANEPMKLVNDAVGALDAIDQTHKAASAPEVLERIESLNQKTFELLKEKSPARLLARVIEMLESISFGDKPESKEDTLERIKDIEHLAYQLEKDLKRS